LRLRRGVIALDKIRQVIKAHGFLFQIKARLVPCFQFLVAELAPPAFGIGRGIPAYVASAKDVRDVVSAAFAILAKYRRSDGWFYVSDEIAVAAIATGAFRTGELIVQVPLSVVGRVAGAASIHRRCIGDVVAAGAILLVKSCIALLAAAAALPPGF